MDWLRGRYPIHLKGAEGWRYRVRVDHEQHNCTSHNLMMTTKKNGLSWPRNTIEKQVRELRGESDSTAPSHSSSQLYWISSSFPPPDRPKSMDTVRNGYPDF
ncbi:hypothetical protein ACFX19_041110 [Malus domestica]